jgi:hypothetical protein
MGPPSFLEKRNKKAVNPKHGDIFKSLKYNLQQVRTEGG